MKKLWIILILGLLIRIFLSASTFHPDILAFKLGGEVVASGRVLNLYDYSNPNIAILNYPPPIYWFHGLFNILFKGMFKQENIVFLKLPYLIFDLLIGFILLRFFSSSKEKSLVYTLWMFNPVNLYSTYMMGQFDIIPTFFAVLSIYFIYKNKLSYAALALGGGIAFKIYPIFLLIPILTLAKNYLEKIKVFILAVLPYLLSTLPYLSSHNFRSSALFANQSSKSLYANISVSGGESILLFPALLILFYLLIWTKRVDKPFFWKIFLIPLLLFFIFTHYHPQWLIWITPLLILDLVIEKSKNIIPILLIVGSWFGSLFFFDPSLTVGIFTPLFPILKNLPQIWVLLNLNIDYNFSRSLLQTILAGASFYLIYYHFPRKNNA